MKSPSNPDLQVRSVRQLRVGDGVRSELGLQAGGGKLAIRRLDLSVSWPWSWDWLAQELTACARLDSPHVVTATLIGRGREEGVLVRPYLAGQDVRSWAASEPRPTWGRVLRVMRELFSGLAALHRLGLVHGGIKPSNVLLVADSDRLVLLDAIISRTQLAAPGQSGVASDVRYLSPEQAGLVHRTVGFAADLYAAGWLLLEVLAERNRITTALPGDLTAAHGGREEIIGLSRAVGVPRPLIAVFARLLAPLPEDRYDSAEDVLAALGSVTDDLCAGLETSGATSRTGRPAFESQLVGRSDEMATLLDHVDKARSGIGAVVCVEGEPGVGKSRLLATVAEHALDEGVVVLRGSAFDQTAQRPLGLFREVFAGLVTFLHRHPEEAARIGAELGASLPAVVGMVPELASVFGDSPAGPSHAAAEFDVPAAAIAATARLFALTFTAQRPGLIALDDCQWADDLSWRLLGRIAITMTEREKDASHVTVLCCARPDVWHRMAALGSTTRVRLDALNPAQSATLITATAGDLPDAIVDYIVGHALGNPLYTLSTLRALIDSSVLIPDGQQWMLDADKFSDLPPVATGPVHETSIGNGGNAEKTEAFVAARLAQLSLRTRQAVQQAAVLGRQFSSVVLASALRSDTGRLMADLDEAVSRGILRQLSQGSNCDDLEFTHDRLREAVLGSLDEVDRRDLHRAAGRALAHAPGRTPYDYELAYHLHHCGEVVAALEPALRAADAALRQHALDVAQTNLSIASAGVTASDAASGPDAAVVSDRARFRVHEGLGIVHMLKGRYAVAADEFEAAYQATPNLGTLESGRVATLLAELALKTGQLADAESWTERAIAALGLRFPTGIWRAGACALGEVGRLTARRVTRSPRRRINSELRERETLAARLHNRLGYHWWFTHAPVWNFWVTLRGVRLAQSSGSVRELSQAYSMLGVMIGGLAPFLSRLGLRMADRSLRLRKDAHDDWGVAQSHHFRGFVLHASRRYEEAIVEFDSAIEGFDILGDRWEQIAARWQKALCLFRRGKVHEAGALARETFWESKRIGDRIGAGTTLAIWVRCLPADVGAETVDRELELVASADRHTRALVHLAAGWKLLHVGDFEHAAVAFHEAESQRRACGIRNHFVAPVVTSQLHAQRLWHDATPIWSAQQRRSGRRAVRRKLIKALCGAAMFGAERPPVLREWAMISFSRGHDKLGRIQLRAALRSARHDNAEGELAACRYVAEMALARSVTRWAPTQRLAPSAETCRGLRLRVDRGVVEALSLRVLPSVADASRHQGVLTAARRIVTTEDTGNILAELRAAVAATTNALDVEVIARQAGDAESNRSGVNTEWVAKPITVADAELRTVLAQYPFGEAADHEQTVEVLATLAGAAIERQALRRESAQRLVEVQEAERGRIARDLHDELGIIFTGILDGITVLGKHLNGESLQVSKLRELAKEGIRSVRSVAWTLRPEGLDDLGVVGCVEQLVEDCSRIFRIRIDVTTRCGDESIPKDVETAAFRIIQEALTNVGRHARASEASVLLVSSKDRIRAVIEDNGTGFDTDSTEQRTSLGLAGMRERARLVGGRVDVESTPGQGTTVMMEVPHNDDWRGSLR